MPGRTPLNLFRSQHFPQGGYGGMFGSSVKINTLNPQIFAGRIPSLSESFLSEPDLSLYPGNGFNMSEKYRSGIPFGGPLISRIISACSGSRWMNLGIFYFGFGKTIHSSCRLICPSFTFSISPGRTFGYVASSSMPSQVRGLIWKVRRFTSSRIAL